MATEQPYDYPGAPIEINGVDRISVEIAHASDAIEFAFAVPDPTWGNPRATAERYLRISRADWAALVAYVAAEHQRLDAALRGGGDDCP